MEVSCGFSAQNFTLHRIERFTWPCVCPERLLSSPEVNNWTVVFDMNAISIDLANSFDDAGHVLG